MPHDAAGKTTTCKVCSNRFEIPFGSTGFAELAGVSDLLPARRALDIRTLRIADDPDAPAAVEGKKFVPDLTRIARKK